jgi:hypothetical protein
MDLLLSSFFDTCDARAKAASSKRPNVSLDEKAPGEWGFFPFFFYFLSFCLVLICSFTVSMHELLSVRRIDLPDVSSLDGLLDFFDGCFPNLQLSNNGALSAATHSLLKVDIPLNTKKEPDMLRVVLPDGFPCQERTRSVLEKLQAGTHIFAAAVSGAGKTKLAFDVAQQHFAFYFDMNGGHGKVAQMDVTSFMEHCSRLDARRDRPVQLTRDDFQHLIASLFLARWIALKMAKRRFPDLTPAQWLWMQTDYANLSQACYLKCVALPIGSMSSLLDLLKNGDAPPLFLIDEAQKLLVCDHWFRSSRVPEHQRPLGYAMVGWLARHGIACLCSGTNLRLKDFHAIRSASGGEDSWKMQYDFDFLDQKSVWQLIDHFLNASQMVGMDDVLALLQGRPRFTASAIKACLTGDNPVQSILAYTQRMMIESEGEASIRANWKRLYEDGAATVLPGAGSQTVWSIAFNMLTRSLFVPSDGEDGGARVTFPLDEHKEVVSRGVSMIKRIEDEPHEFMAEPLVLSAGLTFCLKHPGLDIAANLLAKLNDVTSDSQHRGKLLEFFVAARIFQSPARFMDLPGWPVTVQLPKRRPFGVLVGVPLTDPRLNFAAFDQCPPPGANYWLALPENQAGPDLVAPRMLFSMKTTSKDQVSSEESKKSIKTTTPSKLYTGSGGAALQGRAWTEKFEETQKAIEQWKAPIVRVRVELPACSPGITPAQGISLGGKWDCKLGDVEDLESRPSDVMLYFDADSCKDTLGIDWNNST